MTEIFSLRHKAVWVAGHNGMVGSAVCRALAHEDCRILQAERSDLDLRRQADVERWVAQNKPDVIILAAARVGGIRANSDYPADFLYDNLMIESNVIHAAHEVRVQKLLFLGSSCIYPRDARQPITEDALLSAALEPTNESYALAKIAGVKLCQSYRRQHGCDFISAMPCNLYGPGDTYDALRSHVIPALIMKMQDARARGLKDITLWGTGKPLREFLHVDDLATALLSLLKNYSGDSPVNIGSGEEISIAALADMIKDITAYEGAINFDHAQPDGVMRKVLDSSRIRALGWCPAIGLRHGLVQAVADYDGSHKRHAA